MNYVLFFYGFHLFAVPANTSWPEYEIAIDYEGSFDSDSCDENSSKSLVMRRHGQPDDMMQSWMDQFEVFGPTFSYMLANVSISVYSLLFLCRLMLTTNAGHLFKSGSQEHWSKF